MSDEIPVAISYSGGTSSEWLIEAVIQGVIPRPRLFAVFSADTGDEHEWTYEAMEQVEERCKRAGIPFFRCRRNEYLPEHLLSINVRGKTRADQPPVFIAKDGGGIGVAEHRCTREFKILPMRRAQSKWLKSMGRPKKIIKWIGYAYDEAHRITKTVTKQDVNWELLEFPAVRMGITRAQQRADLARWTGRAPRFSMCRICPKKSPKRWFQTGASDLSYVYPVDESIRDLSRVGLTEGEAFLTDRLIPIETLIRKGDPQPNLPALESYCDGGACFL